MLTGQGKCTPLQRHQVCAKCARKGKRIGASRHAKVENLFACIGFSVLHCSVFVMHFITGFGVGLLLEFWHHDGSWLAKQCLNIVFHNKGMFTNKGFYFI